MQKLFLAFLATGVTQVTNFASGILLARTLGPQARGEMAQLIAWFGFVAPIMLLGINDGVTFYRSRRPEESDEILTAALRMLVGLSAIGIAVCVLVIGTALSGASRLSHTAAWLFLLYVPLYHLQQVLYSFFQAGRNALTWTVVRIVPGIVYVGGLIALAALRQSTPVTVIAANAIGLAASVGTCIVFVRRGGVRLHAPSVNLMRQMFRYSLPLVFQKIAVVCRDNLDRMILPAFIATSLLGRYVVAGSVAYLIYIVGMTIDLVSFPTMVQCKEDSERRALAEFFFSLTFWSLVVTVVVFALIRGPVVHLLFGRAYAQSADLVPYFLVAGAAQALRMVLGGTFKAFGRSRPLAGVEMVGSATMLVILVGFGGTLGVYAGVLAHILSAFVALALAIVLAVRTLKLSPVHMLVPRRRDVSRTVSQVKQAFRKLRAGRGRV